MGLSRLPLNPPPPRPDTYEPFRILKRHASQKRFTCCYWLISPDEALSSLGHPWLAHDTELQVDENISLGVVYPGVTATNFYDNLAEGHQSAPAGATPVDSAESVATKILEAVETQAAEVYADNLKKALSPS